jgi:hypothetical protein
MCQPRREYGPVRIRAFKVATGSSRHIEVVSDDFDVGPVPESGVGSRVYPLFAVLTSWENMNIRDGSDNLKNHQLLSSLSVP